MTGQESEQNDVQHEITRHLMTAAARLQSLPIGKRLVLKIKRNPGGTYTFAKNEEETPAYQNEEVTQQPVEPLNPTQRAEFAAQADKIRQIASGLQESESVTFSISELLVLRIYVTY
ncbi:hypothetical protein QFC20_007785 [Naganishia adeliensis]|uniref:Uncharacterized protein n=1 Tax=Naganishia adeliensis TaxID=92952 RepID=A0ACC2UX11_9TREE|nr:hypothetical protein QFC20_007785 [Naganishia adeliensis]